MSKEYVTGLGKFSYEEFLVSGTHPGLLSGVGLPVMERSRIQYWVQRCGDPWRLAYPENQLFILSGYRTLELNNAVGGATDSDHRYGCAVDCMAKGMSIEDLFVSILEMGLEYRQLRCYVYHNYLHWSWNVPGRSYKREACLKLDQKRGLK